MRALSVCGFTVSSSPWQFCWKILLGKISNIYWRSSRKTQVLHWHMWFSSGRICQSLNYQLFIQESFKLNCKWNLCKFSVNFKCIIHTLHRTKTFFKIHNLFKGFSHLQHAFHKKQFVLIQVTTSPMVLLEYLFIQRQLDNGSQGLQFKLRLHKITKKIILYFILVPLCSCPSLL